MLKDFKFVIEGITEATNLFGSPSFQKCKIIVLSLSKAFDTSDNTDNYSESIRGLMKALQKKFLKELSLKDFVSILRKKKEMLIESSTNRQQRNKNENLQDISESASILALVPLLLITHLKACLKQNDSNEDKSNTQQEKEIVLDLQNYILLFWEMISQESYLSSEDSHIDKDILVEFIENTWSYKILSILKSVLIFFLIALKEKFKNNANDLSNNIKTLSFKIVRVF
jgi:hypothetical protein